MKNEWEATLMDYEFMQAKVEAGLLGDLLDDYERMAEAAEEVRLVGGAVRLSGHVLRVDKRQLPNQLWGRLYGTKTSGVERFLESAAGSIDRPWLRPIRRSLESPGGSLIRVLVSLGSGVHSVVMIKNGTVAVSLTLSELRVWDLKRSTVIKTISRGLDRSTAVAVSADGETAVTYGGYDDHRIQVWKLSQGKCIHALAGHTDRVNCVAITPDGSRAVSASSDCTLKVWCLSTGREIHGLIGHSHAVKDVSVSSDGRSAISLSLSSRHMPMYQTVLNLVFWNLQTGELLRSAYYCRIRQGIIAASGTPLLQNPAGFQGSR
jgi:WD40 repeat protein